MAIDRSAIAIQPTRRWLTRVDKYRRFIYGGDKSFGFVSMVVTNNGELIRVLHFGGGSGMGEQPLMGFPV